MEINVLVDAGLEAGIDIGWLQEIAGRTLAAQDTGPATELGLVIAGGEQVQQLNREYRGKDHPTDVLAFAMFPHPLPTGKAEGIPFVIPPDGIRHLGEVIISYPQAVLQAEEHRHPVDRELAILVIHGVLHLLGYRDDEPELKRVMAAREAEILAQIESAGHLTQPQ